MVLVLGKESRIHRKKRDVCATRGVRAGTRPQAILYALKNPESIKNGVDSQGRPYKMFVGKDAEVVVNPQSGNIVSVRPTSGTGAH
jgi:hypothetical protein